MMEGTTPYWQLNLTANLLLVIVDRLLSLETVMIRKMIRQWCTETDHDDHETKIASMIFGELYRKHDVN